MKMKELVAKEEDLKKFVNEIAVYYWNNWGVSHV